MRASKLFRSTASAVNYACITYCSSAILPFACSTYSCKFATSVPPWITFYYDIERDRFSTWIVEGMSANRAARLVWGVVVG